MEVNAKRWLDVQKPHEAEGEDERANIFKVQYLPGIPSCIGD
jgi:hypothetical protein